MRKTLLLPVLALASAGTLTAQGAVIEPASQSGGCNRNYYAPARVTDADNPVQSSLAYRDGHLTFSFSKIYANCGTAWNMVANTDIPGELHFILTSHLDGEDIASCICMYELEFTFDGIEPGRYDIFFDMTEMEHSWMKKLSATVEEGSEFPLALDTPAGMEGMASAIPTALSVSRDHVVTVGLQGETELEILDADGRLVSVMTLQAPAEVSLATLPSGLYLLRATNAETTATLRTLR